MDVHRFKRDHAGERVDHAGPRVEEADDATGNEQIDDLFHHRPDRSVVGGLAQSRPALESEAHDIGSDGKRNELLSADSEGHRRGLDRRVQRNAP